VEFLKQKLGEMEEQIRLAELRVGEKNRMIIYLKHYLQTFGYRVDTEEATKEKTMK
jgi:hypothetical protein